MKKHLRAILCLLLALCMALCFAACADTDDDKEEKEDKKTSSDKETEGKKEAEEGETSVTTPSVTVPETNSNTPNTSIEGTYILCELVVNGTVMDSATLEAQAASNGYAMTEFCAMVLNPDSTGVWTLSGTAYDIEWDSYRLFLDGEGFAYTFENGKLSVNIEGQIYVFQKQ